MSPFQLLWFNKYIVPMFLKFAVKDPHNQEGKLSE